LSTRQIMLLHLMTITMIYGNGNMFHGVRKSQLNQVVSPDKKSNLFLKKNRLVIIQQILKNMSESKQNFKSLHNISFFRFLGFIIANSTGIFSIFYETIYGILGKIKCFSIYCSSTLFDSLGIYHFFDSESSLD